MFVKVGTTPTQIAVVNKGDIVANIGPQIVYIDTTIANVQTAPTGSAFPLYPNSSIVWNAAGGMLWAIDPSGSSSQITVTPAGNESAAAPTATQITSALISSQLSATIAAAIKAAGVPPIDTPAALSIVFNQSVAPGADFVTSRINVSQYQSVVGTIYVQEQAGGGLGTNPYTRVRAAWSLQADNFDPLVTEDWVVANGPLSFTSNYRNDYSSPCYGDTLTMTYHNYDSKAVNVTYGVFGSYRTRSRSVLRGRYPDDLSNEANGLGSDDILCSVQYNTPVLPGFTADLGLLQLWEGPATVIASFAGGALNQTFINITPEPDTIIGTGYTIINSQNASFLNPQNIILPRRVCRVSVHNGSGSGSNLTAVNVQIVGQVQPN